MIPLAKPLVIFDLETTGLNVERDRIIEIGAIRLEGGKGPERYATRVNPGCPIPSEITKLTGIADVDVQDAPTMMMLKAKLCEFFLDADLCGFNAESFDAPFLANELKRIGIDFELRKRKIVDCKKIFMRRERRDLEAASMFYVGRKNVGWHGAESDAETTFEVLKAQIEKYAIGPTIDELVKEGDDFDPEKHVDRARKFYWKNGEPTFAFGKYAHTPIRQVKSMDRNYLSWLCDPARDFEPETRQVMIDAMKGSIRKRESVATP